MPRGPEELREAVERYVDGLELTPELGTLAEPVRDALGGKRVRPVLCLATGEALGAELDDVLPAAAALELVHSFSLVHDDLPALDDDRERRGAPSVWARHGEAAGILAGDALLVEAFRLALVYPEGRVARELAAATLHMIGGQWLDIRGDGELEELHRLKTGALFAASVGCALEAAGLPSAEQAPWRAFGAELGPLFQIVDDLLDGDGYVLHVGAGRARELADEAAERALARLAAIAADTTVLEEIVTGLASRTA